MTAPCSKCARNITRNDSVYINVNRWVCFRCKKISLKQRYELNKAKWKALTPIYIDQDNFTAASKASCEALTKGA